VRRPNRSSTGGGAERAYLLVLGAAIACYAALGAVLAALPDEVPRRGGGALAVGVAVGAPALTGALGRPLAGRWADRTGPARVMAVGAAVMAAGVLPVLAPGVTALVASRLVVGAGEATMMAAGVLWLLRLAGPERQGRALGHIGLANYAGLTVGPLLARPLGGAAHMDRIWVLAAVLPLLGTVVSGTAARVHRTVTGEADGAEREPFTRLLAATARPGLGLLAVNVGYVALLSFGAAAARSTGVGGLVVPLFGAGVICSRTLLAAVPDRAGPVRTLVGAAAAEAGGLVLVALAPGTPLTVAGLLVLSIGQGLAVPSLGLLALARVPVQARGAAAGAFFAWFDAGVGLGGPLAGLAARAADPAGALLAASAVVAAAAPVALLRRRSRRGRTRTVGGWKGHEA
jgi:predicted MFS family arabinose efflux permease